MERLHFLPLPGVFAPPPRPCGCATCGCATCGCANCGVDATLRCSGCREESTDYHGPVYCGVAHQRVDWPRHKAECQERAADAAGLDVAAIVFSLEPGGRHRVKFGAETRELTEADSREKGPQAYNRLPLLDLITVVELTAGLPTHEGDAGLALDAGGAAVALVGASRSRNAAHGCASVETWKTSRPDGRLRVADVVALVMHRYDPVRVATLDADPAAVDAVAATNPTAPKAIQLMAHGGQRPTYMTVPA
ncbi:hypothetical protein M885DRAFT_562514 [Pelagophyceae sp. CCMP2097]|nr:hypothetical protein M885DRAFT_562514 [Pelagophyceae sp. CCMP2097]